MIVKRVSILSAVLLVLFLSLNVSAADALRLNVHSAILMDMKTGRLLVAQNADAPIQPASITKVLTLYLADEAIRDGRVRPGDPVKISRKAERTRGSTRFVEAGRGSLLAGLL